MNILVICENCGKEVSKRKCDIKNSKHLFCNCKCMHEYQKNHSGSMRKCPVCGKEFYKKGNTKHGE